MNKCLFLLSGIIFFSLCSYAKNVNEKFEKPIIRFLPAMQECRSPETTKNVTATGKVVVDYQIDDKGSLHKLKINDAETTLNDLNIQKCVADVMKKIKFPKAAKGKIVSISYPVEFK